MDNVSTDPVTGTASVGEVELAYELSGRRGDPTVVLVSGLSRPHVGWDDRLVEMFVQRGFSVLRFDNRDCGRSTHFVDSPPFDWEAALSGDRSAVAYTLDDMADDTAGLLQALELSPVHLVGASMGGMIAQMTAVRHPEVVRSLCSIMSTTGARGVGQATPEAQAVLRNRAPEGRQAFIEFEMGNHRITGSDGRWADDDWSRQVYGRLYDYGMYPAGTGRQLMAIMVSGDRTAALGGITVPTVVIHGDADTLIGPSGGRATAAAIPGAELIIVEGMGHELPPLTWPIVVDAVLTNVKRSEGER